jgi:cytoskeletal protein CcmA (bactofilin family)
MTDPDYMSTPLPARPVHNILPRGRNASDGNSLAPASLQDSNMSIGPGIQLKGEISKCATLVVEGDVNATLDGKALEIAQRGVFCGTARVESASIQGRFEGDLTVSGLLRVESGGSATGKLRYGQLEVAEGGDITGEISKNTDEDEKPTADDSVEVADEDEKPTANDSVEVTDENS